MTSYWDTSAAINALISEQVFRRLDEGEHFARVHLLSEFFATMTGRGIRVIDRNGQAAQLTLSAEDAVSWLRVFASKVTFIELDADEMLEGFDKAKRKGVTGGKVHDYVHALAAEKAKVGTLLTRNTRDFTGLTATPLAWP